MRDQDQRGVAGPGDLERLYRAAFAASPDAIIVSTVTGTIIAANQAAAVLHGYASPEELIGLHGPGLVCPADRPRAEQHIRALAEGHPGTPQTLECTAQRKDGSTIEVEGTITLVCAEPDETPPALLIRIRDISDKKRVAAQLAHADRLASIGLLAAGIAHEINNPLTYVMFSLTKLAGDLPGLLTEPSPTARSTQINKAVELATAALTGMGRVRDIVRNLSVFTRFDDQEATAVSINEVVKGATNMAFNQIKYRAQLVEDYGEVPLIQANQARLYQVFLNLLVNAAQAIEEGAPEKNEVRVRTWADEHHVCAAIEDTGRGIPAEDLSRIFQPFFSRKDPPAGSGLGLSISREIIESYGGEIDVSSAPQRGSRFTVSIPREHT